MVSMRATSQGEVWYLCGCYNKHEGLPTVNDLHLTGLKVTPDLRGCPRGKIHMSATLKENTANYILLESLINVDFRKNISCGFCNNAKENGKQP